MQNANGIINQCNEYQNKISELKSENTNAKELKSTAEETLKEKEAEETKTKEELLKNVTPGECSASKSVMENLLSAKDYDLSKCKGQMWEPHTCATYGSAEEFEQNGYIKNSDGSFTDPRTGVTMMNVKGDNYTWTSQYFYSSEGEVEQYGTRAAVSTRYPGVTEAIKRNAAQNGLVVTGYDSNGQAILEYYKKS